MWAQYEGEAHSRLAQLLPRCPRNKGTNSTYCMRRGGSYVRRWWRIEAMRCGCACGRRDPGRAAALKRDEPPVSDRRLCTVRPFGRRPGMVAIIPDPAACTNGLDAGAICSTSE